MVRPSHKTNESSITSEGVTTIYQMYLQPGENRWDMLDAGDNGPAAVEIDWRGLCPAMDSYVLIKQGGHFIFPLYVSA